MAAIITSKFRLDSTNKFVESLSDNQFYMALGRPNAWTDDASPDTPYENDYASNTLWENMFAMKRVDAADIVHCTKRNLWVSGTTYVEYDDRDTNIESKVYHVITTNNNVYMCLKAGAGASSTDPDATGVQTTGVINHSGSDGYIWKYMFTVNTTNASKFLTSSFIPVLNIKENPGSGDLAKAFAAGADAVMIGSLFAGTDEAPGKLIKKNGKLFKSFRGMGSVGAMNKGSADRYFQTKQKDTSKYVPEGVEGFAKYKGDVESIIYKLIGGLRSSMGYLGSKNIIKLRIKPNFVKITKAGFYESMVHNVDVVKNDSKY